ncbi:conserved hypothetical protein [Ricinus communis]|uniref:RNase H type-1 domain-containing protein n=1 Tax=Ricinus communis TaxID=3988 RepID=B9S8H5_RICCO|nr:conserved hypothetical protein [Ricinus communis]
MGAVVLWCSCNNRNNIVWKSKGLSAMSLISFAVSFLQKWKTVQSSLAAADVWSLIVDKEKWKKPAVTQRLVWAACYDIPWGEARSFSWSYGFRVTAEAICTREALSWIKSRFFNLPILLESDSLNALKIRITSDAYLGSVIGDCKALANELNLISCSFIRRSENNIAHA